MLDVGFGISLYNVNASHVLTHLPHAESQVSVLGLEFAVVGLDEHALVAPRRLPRVQLLAVQQLVVGGDDALGGNSIG